MEMTFFVVSEDDLYDVADGIVNSLYKSRGKKINMD